MKLNDYELPELIPDWVLNPDPSSIYYDDEDNAVILDFETTNIENGDPINESNYIVSAVTAVPRRRKTDRQEMGLEIRYHDFTSGPDNEFLTRINNASFIVAHNAKFELQWLKRLGFSLETIKCFCTQIGEYVLRGNHQTYSLALDAALERRNLQGKEGLVSKLIKNGVCPSEIPRHWLDKYCKQDVQGCWELFLDQRKKLWETGQEKVFYTKCLQTPCLADIEFNGMYLDAKRVKKLYADRKQQYDEVCRQLDEFTGGLNPRSGKQMAEFIYQTLGFAELKDKKGNPVRTAGGQPSTSEATLNQLTARNKRQRRFLELKHRQGKLNAELTKSIDKFYSCVMEAEREGKPPILYASINQTRTKTGRYSSQGRRFGVQFQNIDRNFKPVITSRSKSASIGEADEEQLEFRVAVFFGQDGQGFMDIEERNDVHQFTANIIGCSRQEAKAHTFKPLYGGVSGTEAEQAYYKAFKEKYPGIAQIQDEWVNTALREGVVTMPTGQKFYYPFVRMDHNGYVQGNTQVRNYPVQYLATAEIVPIAVVFAWHCYKSLNTKTFMVNTIHDSIISEVFEDERELFDDVMVQALQSFPQEYMKKLYGVDFNVRLDAETKVGSHWSEPDGWEEKMLGTS